MAFNSKPLKQCFECGAWFESLHPAEITHPYVRGELICRECAISFEQKHFEMSPEYEARDDESE